MTRGVPGTRTSGKSSRMAELNRLFEEKLADYKVHNLSSVNVGTYFTPVSLDSG